MEWDAIEEALPAAVRTILGEDFDAAWEDAESAWTSEQNVRLSIFSETPKGQDEERQADVDEGAVQERIYGVRRLTIQVKVESRSQRLADSAHKLASTLRTGLRRSDVAEILNGAGLALATIQPSIKTDYTDHHGRRVSAVLFDVFFNASSTEQGPEVPLIKRAEITGPTGAIEIPLD